MSYKISRRSFLKATAMTAAAVAVAGTTTGCSVAPFEPPCSELADTPIKFGNYSISYRACNLNPYNDGNAHVVFMITNNSDKDITVPASAFRASANKVGDLKVKGIYLTDPDQPVEKVTIRAKTSDTRIFVVFAGTKDDNNYPLTVKLHQGSYTLKYIIKKTGALVTPQPYWELIW